MTVTRPLAVLRRPGVKALASVARGALDGLDLTRARIGTVRGIASRRGAAVTPAQLLELAPLLAAHLGIDVRAG
jgi:hypothetical protein